MPDLGPNCLQRLSADDMSGKVIMQEVKYNGLTQSCQNPKGSEVSNNLDPDQASMVIFTDTVYTYKDT